jgi:hypothetical protein
MGLNAREQAEIRAVEVFGVSQVNNECFDGVVGADPGDEVVKRSAYMICKFALGPDKTGISVNTIKILAVFGVFCHSRSPGSIKSHSGFNAGISPYTPLSGFAGLKYMSGYIHRGKFQFCTGKKRLHAREIRIFNQSFLLPERICRRKI